MAKKKSKKVPFNMNDWHSDSNITNISTANTLEGVTWMIDMSDHHQQRINNVSTVGYWEVISYKPYTKEVINDKAYTRRLSRRNEKYRG